MIKYDSVGDEYVTMAAMPAARANFAAATVNGTAYVIGGFVNSETASKNEPQVSLPAAPGSSTLGFSLFCVAHLSLVC